MKKICFVNYDMTVTGGVEQVTTTLANEFCKEYEVYIYAIFGKGGHVPYDLDPRITYRAELEEECRVRDRIKKTFQPFREFVRQNQIDVVFLMENYPAMTVSPVRFFTKAKYVFCDHGALMNEWEKKDIRFFRFWDSLISHCTVTLTEQNRQDYIRKFHINPKKIRSIYNWIKPEILTMRKKYKADSRKIITGGRFSEEKGYDLRKLHEHVAIQINDTHPSMVIPELIRLLVQKQIDFNEAIEIVQKTCAYTNHTILAEALEKWPVDYLEQVAPQIVPIIRDLDARIKGRYKDPRVHIIDDQNRVHMAHMDIHYGYSVNGVAYLHTEILKNEELKPFYDIYPQKFNNKTNGITFRRWLLHCNHELTAWLDEKIGPDYRKDATKLEKLLDYVNDEETLKSLLVVKQKKKEDLAAYLKETQGLEINPNSIFDIQVKRLHEYKRQQMNALYVIYKYLEIKSGKKPETPITVIFGAKAAPAYIIAKDIIHLILCLQELIDNDPEVAPYLKVVMVENYNVTLAEKLIPSCDISEQISLASKEASGTGNMKFMLNGAVTIGTEDGANVEIHQFVGDENIYIFGESSEQVIEHYRKMDYNAVDDYINDEEIRRLVDFIISPELLRIGDKYLLLELHAELIRKDWFMTLLDVKDYIQKKEQAYADYEDRMAWAKKMVVNIAKAGYFSSDRTIAEYNRDIWHL